MFAFSSERERRSDRLDALRKARRAKRNEVKEKQAELKEAKREQNVCIMVADEQRSMHGNGSGNGAGTRVGLAVGVCEGNDVGTVFSTGLGTAVGASVGEGMGERRFFVRGQGRRYDDWRQSQGSTGCVRAARVDQTISSSGRSVGTTGVSHDGYPHRAREATRKASCVRNTVLKQARRGAGESCGVSHRVNTGAGGRIARVTARYTRSHCSRSGSRARGARRPDHHDEREEQKTRKPRWRI